jgi:two-component system LytT family sensor kinase
VRREREGLKEVLLFLGISAFVAFGMVIMVWPVAGLLGSPLGPVAAFALLAVIAFGILIGLLLQAWLKDEPDHAKALMSHQILSIANETLPYLRQGLKTESASRVAQIIWKQSDAIAVAITDRQDVLAFRGVGESHHEAGKPLMTRATREALQYNESRILESKADIGCPVEGCPLQAAIVVPLSVRSQTAGTLKFYYSSREKLTESHIAVAEGLAKLLSTQLELSEIDRQTELAVQAELKALQAQINPHFMFNTLNTIAMFCRTKPGKARELLIQFADFFRKSLERPGLLVSLREELDYVNSYLVFEKARFGNTLQVSQQIDPHALTIRLPALTVQPLVENAVKHGAPEDRVLTVSVKAEVGESEMVVEVKDNGIGIRARDMDKIFEPGFGKGIGVGLHNVNERLKNLYGREYGLKVISAEGTGTVVIMRVPLETSSIMGVGHEA